MPLHHVTSLLNKKSKKRIGRGGKRGTTSGRGTKGQKSRSGHRIRPAVRDLILRLPKRRGYKNRPFSTKPLILNLSKLAHKITPLSEGKKIVEVDREFLKGAGIIAPGYRGEVKILNGKIDIPISVKGIKLSKPAKEKIEKAGGHVITNQHRINTDENRKLPRKSA